MVDGCGLASPRADWSDQMVYLSPRAGEGLSIRKTLRVDNDDVIVPQPSSQEDQPACILSHLGDKGRDSLIT